jgi:membrane fusion protein, heavy metal efflux system
MACALACVFVLNTGCSKHPAAAAAAVSEVESAGGAISPEAARTAGIEVVAAQPARIRTTLTLYGTIRPNAERVQEVRARYPGVVRSVSKRAGDSVRKGEEVLTVESNESLQVYPVRSQFNGRLLDRRTNPGDAVESSAMLLRIADLSTVWVEFSVFARDVDHVRPGMTVFIQSADEDARSESQIEYVSPAGEADTQSITARAVIDNRDGHWIAGQFVTGQVVIADVQVAVAVVPTALQELQGKPVVFVQSGRRFEPRQVELGRRAQEAVEIRKGLEAGELYAARNSYLIKADLLKSEGEED